MECKSLSAILCHWYVVYMVMVELTHFFITVNCFSFSANRNRKVVHNASHSIFCWLHGALPNAKPCRHCKPSNWLKMSAYTIYQCVRLLPVHLSLPVTPICYVQVRFVSQIHVNTCQCTTHAQQCALAKLSWFELDSPIKNQNARAATIYTFFQWNLSCTIGYIYPVVLSYLRFKTRPGL